MCRIDPEPVWLVCPGFADELVGREAPDLVAAAGDRAAYRFLEFFTAQIRNPHTRRAYVRAVSAFCAWLEARGVPSIAAAGSIHVATYIEDLGHR